VHSGTINSRLAEYLIQMGTAHNRISPFSTAALATEPNALARVDLRTREVTFVDGVGPADREGGISSNPDSVW
jgi:hypothetical protein